MDFYTIKERVVKRGLIEIYPDFLVCRSKDLMVRGNSFYAVWDQEAGLWATSEFDIQRMIDADIYSYRSKHNYEESAVVIKSMRDFSTNSWASFKKYLKNMPDNSRQLDEKLTFANTEVKKRDYVSKRLGYSLEAGDYSAWTELASTLYDPEQLEKIEWCIGSIVSGDSRDIQKFAVFYGEAGAGKSTILNIIQKLFEGYYVTFDAKALTSSNNVFATEVFRTNPLVAIQHDGDLSRIEDNTKLNSIVSHEIMVMNEKYKSSYSARANCFLFMATNRPVKITDGKSGVIRRLIDITPSNRKLPPKRYQALMAKIDFQLGAIAQHCLEVYQKLGKHYYDSYRPKSMILQTDVFFNFVEWNYDVFREQPGISLTNAYAIYKKYCEDALVEFKLPRHKFREELKNYFHRFYEVTRVDGKQVRSWYEGFITEKFETRTNDITVEEHQCSLSLDLTTSLLDEFLADCPAQYANESETPSMKWADVRAKLKDISTDRLHYVKPPSDMIVIDFDLKDESGEKSMERNLEEASKWPATYAEFSKGGAGVHLHYIYDGDVAQLNPLYAQGIEVKVFKGGAALRRKVSKCNGVSVAHISSGLPLKEVKPMVDKVAVKTEKKLIELIKRNLRKEIHPGTKPSIDFIHKILKDAYNSGLVYDVTPMYTDILKFALHSSHHSEYCLKKLQEMKLKSEVQTDIPNVAEGALVFFDVEVFPNLFLVNYKFAGDHPVVRMVNPSPQDIEFLLDHKLVGFNCRRYDNHIIYARYLGYTNDELFKLSMDIVSGEPRFFSEAYNLSYTDVYDFSSTKQSLKKFEIELGIHHQELGLPWDKPVPEERWDEVAAYCDNDVLATEAVFNARKADWTARQILSDLAGMTVNDTTNSLTTRIIFGRERKPQRDFNYRFLGDCSGEVTTSFDDEFTAFSDGKPVFPGYTFDRGKSVYRDEEVGEGGYVYAEPGIYRNVALLDIASMHPSSIVAEKLFGEYTKNFEDILNARIAIKHRDFDRARSMLSGKLTKYLSDESAASDLAQALKIAINSVYGLTSAKFDNPFRDIRNKDNIVAKRGALFMVNLKHQVQSRGFTVAHIKTDSIKIPNATPDIIQFVMDYGRMYGYNFEHEATYDRMCLVNDAVYIARYSGGKHDGEWTATGTEFQRPYVFKRLFSQEPIEFKDLCETKSVTTALYLDYGNDQQVENFSPTFVGRVGLFCPVKEGYGGGTLLREKDGKFYAATGTKGYLWMESEVVERMNWEEVVDRSYYEKMVCDAVEHISQFGDYYEFAKGE